MMLCYDVTATLLRSHLSKAPGSRSRENVIKKNPKQVDEMVASEAPDGRSEARNNNLYHELRDKMAELSKTKAEIQRAKDSATQSWLDSRPMIDELEKLQLQLESARKPVTETENIISHLQMELESVHRQIRDRNEGGREANKTISETNQALDQLRDDMEELKEAADEEKRMRKKLKQTLRVKRQELRKVQLTLRAVRMETDGYTVSEGEALQHVNRLEKENMSTVQLSVEDYAALTKRAKEETSLGDWRVLISVEQRVVAEAAREAAVKRLKEFYSEQRSKNKVAEEDEHVRQEMLPEEDEHVAKIPISVSTRTNSVNASSRRTDPSHVSGLKQHQRSVGGKRRNVPQKKKTSIFYKIKAFLCAKNNKAV